jgi:hypothetical protein
MSMLWVEWPIRIALMAAGTAVVLRLLRVRTAAARHAAWTAVLAVMLLMPAWSVWGPRFALPVLPEARHAASFEPQASGSIIAEPLPAQISTSRIAVVPSTVEQAEPWDWGKIALSCYFAGVGLMLMRLIAGTLQARALVRRAVAGDGFRVSGECAAPVTVGWFRPVILLPKQWRSWPAAELDAVLIHEREHARRRDPLVQWLALLNRAIFWFHPVAWWLERNLSQLSEEVCDAAVLRSGHNPHLYSEYLIDLAGAVRRAGGRLPLWGTAMSGGGVLSRIERILDGTPVARLSRGRAIVAAGLCGMALATFAACSVERVQKANPGQLSMNEMNKREAVERMKIDAESKAQQEEAKSFTPEQAAGKLASLKSNPQDERLAVQLIWYYRFHSDLKGQNELALWYIEHAPDGKLPPPSIKADSDRAAYERGKQLWLANLKKPGVSAEVYERAALYMQGSDKPLAEEILLAGRAAYPEDARWARALGQLYAGALAKLADPGMASYARNVRTKLEQSTDAKMLTMTAQWLTVGSMRQRRAPDTLALAELLASRAVAADPGYQTAKSIAFRVQEVKSLVKRLELQKLSPEQQGQLGDADRLLLLKFEMDQAWGPSFRTPNLDLSETKARELLELARKAPNEARSAFAIYEANIMLGKVALRRGNREESAKYLVAAADAPASDELRYSQIIPLNLPRTLIDWGEREAAAQYFERMAPKTLRTEEFQKWAVEIRKGNNPEKMWPTMSGCGQEPC